MIDSEDTSVNKLRQGDESTFSWPQACVGCGATNDLRQEEISIDHTCKEMTSTGENRYTESSQTIRLKGTANICPACQEIAVREQRQWRLLKFVKAFFAFILYSLVYIAVLMSAPFIFWYTGTFVLFDGLAATIAVLHYDEAFIKRKQYDSFLLIEPIDSCRALLFTFRDPRFKRVFKSKNPSLKTKLDEMHKHPKPIPSRLPQSILILLVVGVGLRAFLSGFNIDSLLLVIVFFFLYPFWLLVIVFNYAISFVFTKRKTKEGTPTIGLDAIESNLPVTIDTTRPQHRASPTPAVPPTPTVTAVRARGPADSGEALVVELKRKINQNPMNAYTWAELAMALADIGRCVDANDAIQRARNILPDDPKIKDAFARCKELCGHAIKEDES